MAAFPSVFLQEDPAPDAMLSVHDNEVKLERWVSPKQVRQRQADQQAAAVKSSDFQRSLALRGVRQMLGEQGEGQGASAGQAQAIPLELARQPWMDLPDSALTPQQRAALKDHDKQVQVSMVECLVCCYTMMLRLAMMLS